MQATLQFIGTIQSSIKSIEEAPLQENENAPEATIIIFPKFVEGIKEITSGSQMLLLTWLHNADRSVIKCVPRRNYSAPAMGVFSTRSPNRPNPIGIHTVKVLSISGGAIKVSALEVVDHTPVVDIKPLRNIDTNGE